MAMRSPARLLASAALLTAAAAQKPAAPSLAAAVVRGHAELCRRTYDECATGAAGLVRAVDGLLAAPSAATLTAARAAWIEARRPYCRTEAFRFHDGPIEAVEPLLNAWPVDEAYIDYVRGDPDAGIVHDAEHFPRLTATVLQLANERGGEANVCIGWHAIEFLLWGQDLRDDGPGDRPYTDFVIGAGRDAARRREYLKAATDLLAHQLADLAAAWAPGAAYRRRFEADVDSSVRRILVGITVLTAFELGGERMAVAYETRDQEQEHSCFSDNSCADFVDDQLGILAVLRGDPATTTPGLCALVAATDPKAAAALERAGTAVLTRVRAIPSPFDQAMRGDDSSAGRRAIGAALAALDDQVEALLIAGRLLGHDLPVRPAKG